MNPPELRVVQRQQQSMSPRLQRAVRLLQLSSLDFVLEVRQAMGGNPFLEGEDDGIDDDRADGDDQAEPLRAGDSSDGDDGDDGDDSDARADAAESAADRHYERDGWQAEAGTRSRVPSGDAGDGGNDWIVAPTTLADHLYAQLNVLPLPWCELVLARAVVESLDDDGYLRSALEDVAAGLALEARADADDMQIALRRVQSLDPAGVGARSVSECLLLQLSQQAPAGDKAERQLAELIVREHLEALASLGLARLARRLGVDEAAAQRACKRIRALDPRPGWRYGANDAQYITPDVIVRKHGTRWVATLNQRVVPRLRLNEVYADLFHRHRSAAHGEMAAQLQEARWTLSNVQQRFATILGVAQAIVDRQGQFLDYGPMAMRPMCLREIADEVGAHPSTICRATNNKYMATPAGVFELTHFFSRALPTTAGGSCSPTAIRGLMRDMFDAENPRSPLTDAQIARQLVDQGLPIVRRTVTKYRQTLLVDVARRRRRSA